MTTPSILWPRCLRALMVLPAAPCAELQADETPLDAQAAKLLIADRVWRQQQAHGPGMVSWTWKADGSVCLRTDEESRDCADAGRWTLQDNRACYELTWWGKSVGRNAACFRIVDKGKGRYEALQNSGFTLFEFSVLN
jgi:hypothetical protein